MSNFAFTTFILMVFLFAAGLALGSLARARYEQQKRIGAKKREKEGGGN
jgi:preprotein translocase subunit SecG